jgi:hypothetical protein
VTPKATRFVLRAFDTLFNRSTASAYRVIDLTTFRAAIVWSTRGLIRWFKASEEFDAFVMVRDQVAKGTYAYDCFNGRTVPDELNAVRANLWLAPSRWRNEEYILEQSVWLPYYESVLTLLYLEQPSSLARDNDAGAPEELNPEDFTLRQSQVSRSAQAI